MQKSFLLSVTFALCAALSGLAQAEPVVQPGTEQTISAPINLNTADAAQLQRALTGIGAVKAQAIVDYREANGAFNSVDELLEVKGIGAATLEKNRDRITVN